MKNVLILHGSGNNSKGNWYPWLKVKLEQKGWKVWAPDLPNADYPDIDEWRNFILSNKKWRFNTESVIIGHSAGATLALGLLQELPWEIKIDKAILVAGFVRFTTLPKVNKEMKGLLKKPFKWEKIKKSCSNFYFIHSNNDRYQGGIEQGKSMQDHLGGKLIIRSVEDHFNLEASSKYQKFPFLLSLLK